MVCTIVHKWNMVLTNAEKRSPSLLTFQHGLMRFQSSEFVTDELLRGILYVILQPLDITEKNLVFYRNYVDVNRSLTTPLDRLKLQFLFDFFPNKYDRWWWTKNIFPMIESAKPISASFQRAHKFVEQHRVTSQILKWFFELFFWSLQHSH